MKDSEYFADNQFFNSANTKPPSLAKLVKITALMATKDRTESEPTVNLPVNTITKEKLDILANDKIHAVRLAHSSILLKVYGEYWLIDPVFAKRASPVSFAGPKRFHAPPIELEKLPRISKVLISHNHYDHLDKSVIKYLASSDTRFLVPLGVDMYLKKWGVSGDYIDRFEWWQELKSNQSTIVFTPTQHFSGRGLFDKNKTLWGSWIIKTPSDSLFFSGDSGYFDGFKIIGDRYGPFDLTFMEAGAYSTQWPDMHMFPHQSVQAHIDLNGLLMMPIHNSTFDLAFHPWSEPLRKIKIEAARRNVDLIMPEFGDIFTVNGE